jgi:hypothetical protein
MTPHPIDTMPADIAEEDLALLFCPEARRVAYGGLSKRILERIAA